MPDRESQKSAEELAHEQERFDIHVMAFADRSARVVASLQQIFALDHDTASRLLADTPILVKRAAPPDVAEALLEVLGRLGAQVVLLPAPVSAELAQQLEALREQSSRPEVKGWGALDLELPAPPASRAPQPDAELVVNEEDPFARELDAAKAAAAQDDELEFDLGAPETKDGTDLPAHATPPQLPALLAFEPTAHTAARPDAPPLLSREPPRMSAPAVPPDLGLGSVPPLPTFSAQRLVPSPPASLPIPPRAPAQPARVAVREPAQARAIASQRQPRPQPQPIAPRPPAQQAAIASGNEPGRSRLEQRLLELGPSVALPALDLEPARDRRAPASPRAPSPGAVSRKPEPEPWAPAMTAVSRARDPVLEANLPIDAQQARPAAAPRERVVPRARGVALLELLGGVLVVYLGLRMGNTVFHGNANWVSVLLHGLAFYGVGNGLFGLRP